MNIVTKILPSPHKQKLVQEALAGVDFALAEPSDAEELSRLFQQFFGEATYKDRRIVFSPVRAEAWLERVIRSGVCPHIIARTHGYDGTIVGAISYSLDESFCEAPVAVLGTLYVVPSHRRTALGRILVAVATEAAAGDGAVAFHAPLASGMTETKSLKNLFAKAGFYELGAVMGRSL